jgi:hypothetical protein
VTDVDLVKKRKQSPRVDEFRFGAESGHRAMPSACPLGRTGSTPWYAIFIAAAYFIIMTF